MAKDSQNDSVDNDSLPETSTAKKPRASRRSVLKTVGVVAGAGLATGAARAAPGDYRTITVDANTTRSIDVGSGETLENVLIDVTAPGALVHIAPRGSDWTVRNVGVRGTVTERSGDTAVIIPQVDAGSTGVMENVYIGDGTEGPNHINGMWVDAGDHEGTLVLRQMNVGHWCDNGLYCSGPGVRDSYGMGEVHIEECYAHDNNISGFRIGTPGSYVQDSVVDNTDGDAPPIPGGAVNARGIWAKEQSDLQAINCDVSNPNGIAVQAGDQGEITLENCRTEGDLHEQSGGSISGSGSESPDLTPPDGVPMSAEEAVSGTAGNGTDETTSNQ